MTVLKICQLAVVYYQDVQMDSSAVCKQFNSVPKFNLHSTVSTSALLKHSLAFKGEADGIDHSY